MKRLCIGALSVLFLIVSFPAFGQELVTSSHAKRFISGDKVIYYDDFHSCPIGEFPSGMDKFLGAVECVRYGDHIWLSPSIRCTEDHESAVYKRLDIGRQEFSIEFDVMALKQHARVMLRILKKKGNLWDRDRFPFDLYFNGIDWDKSCGVNLEKVGHVTGIKHCPKTTVHLAIQVRRGQFRVYVNGKRVVMKAIEKGAVSGFEISFPADTDKYGILVSNIKVAEYTEKEAKPTPESLGISVKETENSVTLGIPEKVLFDFNKFTLKRRARIALSVVADILRKYPHSTALVTGYTDNIGSDAYNMRLSLQRAQSVADYLMYVENLPSGIFTIEGRGKTNPIATNSTEEGRAKNRRGEIRIIKPKETSKQMGWRTRK